MNKSIKNLRIKTISIVCASLAVLAIIIGLAFVSLSPSKAAPGQLNITFDVGGDVSNSFPYGDAYNSTNIMIQALSEDGSQIVESHLVDISATGSQNIAFQNLEIGTTYVLKFIVPTFSTFTITTPAGELNTLNYKFTMSSTPLSLSAFFMINQETWFNDSNVF